MPAPEPFHPAEDAALSLLKSGRSPNSKDVKRLFSLVDKSPSPRPCVDDGHDEEELSSFSTGCFPGWSYRTSEKHITVSLDYQSAGSAC